MRISAVTALVAVIVTSVMTAVPAMASPPGGTGSTLPAGMPPAAYRSEPALPSPQSWPFPESFPKTSGTGRYDGGAFFWTDFLYDDGGARGVSAEGSNPRGGASHSGPTGTYRYARAEALRNGSDIFRAAVGNDENSTYWRVDWNTLTKESAPIAAFLLDTDHSIETGLDTLPANIGADAPGTDLAILLTSDDAWLVDRTGWRAVDNDDYAVDFNARSFVLRLPASVLGADGTWRMRLVSGAADGADFRTVTAAEGALPGQPNVYNAAFRSREQELAAEGRNSWMEARQAAALADGTIAPFGADLDWQDLRAERWTPEPQPKGHSNRWYVSNFDFGQGMTPVENGVTDLTVVPFPGRVQPYGIYVPAAYDLAKPAPLTWMMHGGSSTHNQFHAYSPKFVQQACEQRAAICVSPLGRGPWGWTVNESELDFWEVWNRVSAAYAIDADRVSMTGGSMGGYSSYRYLFLYPHLFAAVAAISPPTKCGTIEVVPGSAEVTGGKDDARGTCLRNGDTGPLVGNARHHAFYIATGGRDELVPVPTVEAQVERFDRLGYRYRYELYPAEDHLLYILYRDGFSSAAAHLDGVRKRRPRHIDYAFYGGTQRPDLGVGPSGAWWLTELKARTVAPGLLAKATAESRALPEPKPVVERSTDVAPDGDPSPAIIRELSWQSGQLPRREPVLDLELRNLRTATVDLAGAGFAKREQGTVEVAADGPTTVILEGLRPGSEVRSATGAMWRAADDGKAAITLTGGTDRLSFSR